jgi:hypothetical protein
MLQLDEKITLELTRREIVSIQTSIGFYVKESKRTIERVGTLLSVEALKAADASIDECELIEEKLSKLSGINTKQEISEIDEETVLNWAIDKDMLK